MVLNPTVPKAKKVTKEDVWEKGGMIVARSDEICPVWRDVLPYKSVTAICNKIQQEEVIYWLEYVYGGESISKIKELSNDKVAIRSNYMCW